MKSLWMLSASFFFSLMAVFVKMGAEDFGTFELIFYRSLAGVILLYSFIRARGYTIRTPYLSDTLSEALSVHSQCPCGFCR